MKNMLKMFVLAFTVLAFAGVSAAAEKGTEKKSKRPREKAEAKGMDHPEKGRRNHEKKEERQDQEGYYQESL